MIHDLFLSTTTASSGSSQRLFPRARSAPATAIANDRAHPVQRLQSLFGRQRQASIVPALAVLLALVVGDSTLAQRQRPRIHPAVVRVIVPDGNGMSLGSGTFVSVKQNQGLVLTNWHVVKTDRNNTVVAFPNGFRSRAKVLKTDKKWDLAALAIARPQIQPVRIANQPPRQGDWLTIAGYGSGNYRAVRGKCSGFLSPEQNHPADIIEMTAVARQGDSGGPMFNQRGELAGVLFGAKPSTFAFFGSGGFTAGSHVGRVRKFLRGVWPAPRMLSPPRREMIAKGDAWTSKIPSTRIASKTRHPKTPTARIARMIPDDDPSPPKKAPLRHPTVSDGSVRPYDGLPRPSQQDLKTPVVKSPPVQQSQAPTKQQRPPTRLQRVPITPVPDPAQPAEEELETIPIGEMLGGSFFAVTKTLLAIVGAFTLMFRFLRGREYS